METLTASEGGGRNYLFKKIYVKMVFGGPSYQIITPLMKIDYSAHTPGAHFSYPVNLKTSSC